MSVRELLQQRRDELATIEATWRDWGHVETWVARTRPLLLKYFPEHLDGFDKRSEPPKWFIAARISVIGSGRSRGDDATDAGERRENDARANKAKEALLAHVDSVIELAASIRDNSSGRVEALTVVERILSRFHAVARQLRDRRDNGETLKVEDEYDVQYLLHALLRVAFDDIRPEEYVPRYAGGASRMDFLLKTERIVVEAKKTRKGLADNELGEQLVVDVARYAVHPDCNTLVCFVYDPEGRIGNATGLVRDLERLPTDGVTVRVFVYPQ